MNSLDRSLPGPRTVIVTVPIPLVRARATGGNYDAIVLYMKRRYALRIRRWRRAMSGCAWQSRYQDGSTTNWIEAPVPRTPISLAIFLHEVGHHAVGFGRYRMRCEEEYHVWLWALQRMRELGVTPDARVARRFNLSMRYAVAKAVRRGVKQLPATLIPFVQQG